MRLVCSELIHSIFRFYILLLIAPQLPTTSVAQTSIDQAQFADSLTTALYASDNECTSSWGISMAFSLVYPSSTEASEVQIRATLGYPSDSRLGLVWNEVSTRIDESYQGSCIRQNRVGCSLEGPIVEISNSIWIDDNAVLNPEYQGVVSAYLRQINFEDRGAGAIINNWVNDTTNGLIDSVVPEGPLSANMMFVANSIYLKASWSNQFSDRQTNQDIFYSTASRSVSSPTSQARFMHQVESFLYSHDALSGFQIVKLDFATAGGNALSMFFVLPLSEESGFASSSEVLEATQHLRSTRIALAIPKFKFETTYEDSLKAALQSIGMVAPFQQGLCIDSQTNCDEYIDMIIQKTFIDVNEKGVEAAAVTMMGMRSTSFDRRPQEIYPFVADHPFQFFICDENENLMLFEGRVGNPGIGEDEPAVATLQAKHSATFWEDNYNIEVMSLPVPAARPTIVRKKPPLPNTTKPKYGRTDGLGGQGNKRRLKGKKV